MLLANALKVEEIALSKAESETLAEAVAEVSKHYPTAVSEKTMAWVHLTMCLGTTYGSRAYVYSKRMERERAAKIANKAPTQEAQQAAQFVEPGSFGFSGPVSEAQGM